MAGRDGWIADIMAPTRRVCQDAWGRRPCGPSRRFTRFRASSVGPLVGRPAGDGPDGAPNLGIPSRALRRGPHRTKTPCGCGHPDVSLVRRRRRSASASRRSYTPCSPGPAGGPSNVPLESPKCCSSAQLSGMPMRRVPASHSLTTLGFLPMPRATADWDCPRSCRICRRRCATRPRAASSAALIRYTAWSRR